MSIGNVLVLGATAAALLCGGAEAQSRYAARGCNGGDQAASTIVGAVIGGVIGGQFGNGGDDRALGAVAGAILGGAAGNSVAASNCDQASDPRYGHGYDYDRQPVQADNRGYQGDGGADDANSNDESAYYDQAFDTAEPNQRVRWNDPQSGNYGYVQPADWYQDENGKDCREFEQTIYIDGRAQQASGTACREPDGSWRIVE